MTALTNAPTGLTFGQLWQGDTADAKKILERLVGKVKFKLGSIEIDEEFDKEERCFAVSVLQVRGTDVYPMMDSGATQNVAYLRLV